MGNLIYIAKCSLDGYTADETGNFEWTEPAPEVHAFVNDLVLSAGTHLYGAGCTRPWPSGRPIRPFQSNRLPTPTSLASGRQPTRLFT
jgi:hypothetical protein